MSHARVRREPVRTQKPLGLQHCLMHGGMMRISLGMRGRRGNGAGGTNAVKDVGVASNARVHESSPLIFLGESEERRKGRKVPKGTGLAQILLRELLSSPEHLLFSLLPQSTAYVRPAREGVGKEGKALSKGEGILAKVEKDR
ncbi:hypothetical protein CEB3_c26940 [Peptococcaceae bacterium CEB3]|nr:hypothetical protein CEB3_c26940 [Peptococcaceae bacterium CEB3]